MPPKRPASSKSSEPESKRSRKTLTIVEKVKLLDMLKEGRTYAAVGRHFGLNESTVRYLSIIPAISVCLSVCLFVCDRRFSTTARPISLKLARNIAGDLSMCLFKV